MAAVRCEILSIICCGILHVSPGPSSVLVEVLSACSSRPLLGYNTLLRLTTKTKQNKNIQTKQKKKQYCLKSCQVLIKNKTRGL